MSTQKETGFALFNELMRTHDLQRLLDLARPEFGNPMILSNGSSSVMAITREDGIEDARWADITGNMGIPMGVLTCGNINGAYRKSLETGRAVLDESGDCPPPMLRRVLATEGRILGYLDAPLYFGVPDGNGMEFFDFVGSLIAMELQRDPARASVPDSMLDYFVYDLLEGRITDPRIIRERLDYFNWNLLSKSRVQIVSIQGREGPAEMDSAGRRRLVDRFSAAFPQFKTFVYVEELKMLCPVKEALRMDEAFCETMEGILRQEGLVAGVSRPMAYLNAVPDFNRQADQALELGRKLRPEQALYFYDNYAVYHALELAAAQEDLYQFCHSAVMLLRDYDRLHETELLESLRVYLTHNRSIGESAAALYIHRNTMNYRIARITELTKLDLGDPDVFCHLLFSFYALDYRALLERDEPGSLRHPGEPRETDRLDGGE